VRAAASAAIEHLATSRPTAVNLFWALERMRRLIDHFPDDHASTEHAASQLKMRLLSEARAVQDEDRAMCRAIGEHGAALIPAKATLLTHCNAGGLATAAWGTALSVMYSCQDQGKQLEVFVDETRPLWQGARLTAWELMQRGIPATIICDSMAGYVMQSRRVDAVIVGADRIAACGDAANKIGTYGLAVLAKYHGIPFYVAAPSSTFDLELASGRDIPIEQRDPREILEPSGIRIAPEGAAALNPAFDVTPAELITALITERGVIRPVNRESILKCLAPQQA
jgi:methylthioribose-1-phosphate isomerase